MELSNKQQHTLLVSRFVSWYSWKGRWQGSPGGWKPAQVFVGEWVTPQCPNWDTLTPPKTAPTFQQGVVERKKQEWFVSLAVVSPRRTETYNMACFPWAPGNENCLQRCLRNHCHRAAVDLSFQSLHFPGVINQLTFKLDEMAYALVWRTDGGLGENCFCRLATSSTAP